MRQYRCPGRHASGGANGRPQRRWAVFGGLATILLPGMVLLLTWASLAGPPTSLAAGDPSPTPSGTMSIENIASVESVARPILTPSTEFGGMPVIYAGAGDGSWPDQMEPNDGTDDVLGPAPVDVGTLYRSLNLLPRTLPTANPTAGEDRDWYVWNTAGGRCYRAFTGDIAGPPGQLTGKWRVQHAIRLWWYPPVKEGRKLLAEYNPSKGPAEGGYFAAATACGTVDGQMAAEVYNYGYALKNPRGLTYTFGVMDVGVPGTSQAGLPEPGPSGPLSNSPGNGAGSTASNTAPISYPSQPASVPPSSTPRLTPTPTWTVRPTDTLVPLSATPTASPSPTSTPSPKPGSAGLPASVDVVAYLDQNQNGAPDPGEGLHDLQVALLSVRTNSVQKTVSTNANGYAHLEWTWAGRVRVALPDLNWSDLVDPSDMASATRPRSDVWSTAEDGSLYLEVRVLPAQLPAVIP
ncbi:MAG: hypothetical protein ABJA50_11035 [Chloroflexota bacterium]